MSAYDQLREGLGFSKIKRERYCRLCGRSHRSEKARLRCRRRAAKIDKEQSCEPKKVKESYDHLRESLSLEESKPLVVLPARAYKELADVILDSASQNRAATFYESPIESYTAGDALATHTHDIFSQWGRALLVNQHNIEDDDEAISILKALVNACRKLYKSSKIPQVIDKRVKVNPARFKELFGMAPLQYAGKPFRTWMKKFYDDRESFEMFYPLAAEVESQLETDEPLISIRNEVLHYHGQQKLDDLDKSYEGWEQTLLKKLGKLVLMRARQHSIKPYTGKITYL